jgi:hypothetical protein
LPYNHANPNSLSGRQRQKRILGNLPKNFQISLNPNKFGPNSKEVLLPEFLIQILF